MSNEEIKTIIYTIISEQLGISEDQLSPESHLINDLGADSLDVVELTMTLEEKFSIQIADEDAQKMKTVSDILSYIESKK